MAEPLRLLLPLSLIVAFVLLLPVGLFHARALYLKLVAASVATLWACGLLAWAWHALGGANPLPAALRALALA